MHGGLLSLLLGEAMGWAYECLRLRDWDDDRINLTTAAVTAKSCHNKPELFCFQLCEFIHLIQILLDFQLLTNSFNFF